MNGKQEAGGRKRVIPVVLTVGLFAAACSRPAARTEASGTARAAGTPTPATGRKVLYWYDPMAPGSKFDKPGKSPFMDMQLVPKYADEEGGSPAAESAAAVTLSPEAIRASGIATVVAARESLSGAIRATGVRPPPGLKCGQLHRSSALFPMPIRHRVHSLVRDGTRRSQPGADGS